MNIIKLSLACNQVMANLDNDDDDDAPVGKDLLAFK